MRQSWVLCHLVSASMVHVCPRLPSLGELDQHFSLSLASELQGQEITTLQEVKQMSYIKGKKESNEIVYSNVFLFLFSFF